MANVIQGQPETRREFLTVQEASAQYGNSPWTWRAWCYSGKVGSVKLGSGQRGRLLIPRSEIDRLFSENLRPRLERQ